MVRRFYNLPSLTMLGAFEAAARHMSFKFAAEELNVTPGAVSRQIKNLEVEAGTALFKRVHRGVELTREGEELFAVLARSFSQTSEVFERLRSRNVDAHVTVAATTAFASQWLMPRLGTFWREHPHITLNHIISDNIPDHMRPEVDLRIHYGSTRRKDEASAFLFDDRIYPVCSKRFARAHRSVRTEDLPNLPLLRLEGVDPEWIVWEEWLRLAGISHGALTGQRFNNYSVILQAALDDRGVALGWERLVAPLLEQGRLVRLTDAEVEAPGAFHVTWLAGKGLTPQAETLKDWLLVAARDAEQLS
jgi:LysR family glycine cleavage system transcriptional activator